MLKDRILNIAEAVDYCGLKNKQSLHHLIHDGKVSAVLVGKEDACGSNLYFFERDLFYYKQNKNKKIKANKRIDVTNKRIIELKKLLSVCAKEKNIDRFVELKEEVAKIVTVTIHLYLKDSEKYLKLYKRVYMLRMVETKALRKILTKTKVDEKQNA